MQRVDINIVRFNHPANLITRCLESVLSQEHPGFTFTVTLTENGSHDSVKDQILSSFSSDSRFTYLDNGSNLGFAGAHNLFCARSNADLVLPLNPDTVMLPRFLSLLADAFIDPRVGAATGKMVKVHTATDGGCILDGTGIVMSRGRRGRERGQHSIDRGQYDSSCTVFGVSGTASAFRKAALDKVRLGEREYFDEDFFAYWEDVDLSWRLRLANYECVYVPAAVVLHTRAVGQNKGGYRSFRGFVKHHRQIPRQILRWNWRNQLFCIIKNDFGWSLWRDLPFIISRQLMMLGYMVAFEPRTLGAIPEFVHLLPKMIRKRRLIQERRLVDSRTLGKWFD